MQEHLDRTRAETAAVREAVERTRRAIEGLGSIEVPAAGEGDVQGKAEGEARGEGDGDAERERKEREVEVWRAADELLA